MVANESISLDSSTIEFQSNGHFQDQPNQQPGLKSRIYTEDGFTSITYDNGFFLKMYRKIDPTTHPDLEITRYLSQQAKFNYVPEYAGAIEWKFANDTIALGMLQVLIENHGDGYGFMMTRINNYIERILAQSEKLQPFELIGSLTEPVGFEELPEPMQLLLGTTASEQAELIGKRTGELHLALAAGTDLKDFAPEDFSLHYQRSLFSSMQSIVRETTDNPGIKLQHIPENLKEDLQEIINRKEELLTTFKRIYAKKLDVIKIRIHGNLHLGQVIFTGRDVVINDFGGDPVRSFSDRRLKRSPLRDVASMVRSFRNVAYDGFTKTTQVQKENIPSLIPFARLWAHYMVGFFMKSYLETVRNTAFIPADKQDLQMMLETYMLEKSLLDLNHELKNQPEKAVVPLRVIKSIIG
jgi:maltose alpha-D-glucosyltransferase/alpha-amylase